MISEPEKRRINDCNLSTVTKIYDRNKEKGWQLVFV